MRVFFEGQVIDGVNHTFTSSLSAARCETLDLYFWSRFPSFKEVESLKQLSTEHNERFIYMRWSERATLRTQKRRIKKEEMRP